MGVAEGTMAVEMAHIFLTDAQELLPPACVESADYFAGLVARARAGDEIAFERIMLATEQRVVSIAWRMLGNRDDARDAAQDVYLRVFKYLARFRAGEDFRGWLYRITINVCHDFARKKGATGFGQLDQIDFVQERAALETGRRGADPESLALQEQQLALIRSALQSLPPKERAALVLRDLEGFSTEEVAQALGSRAVTVRSQVSSARAKIKTYCDKLARKKGAS
ncbi:MAG: sigma-70 family RNA polymerase sigma factor [Acidobacteria bacterium]|nr:MAG: sigma-70 family RNA polymerase sigma factor [Acidobacteriota bacterium]